LAPDVALSRLRRVIAHQPGTIIMILLAAFIISVVVGDLVAIAIAEIVEYFSKSISLFVFLGLFVVVIPIAWHIAVRFTEPKPAA